MKRWWKLIIAAVLLIVFGVCGYMYYIYDTVKTTADRIYEPIRTTRPVYRSTDQEVMTKAQPRVEGEEAPAVIAGKKPFNVLVMGVDQRPGDSGRSDTIILLAVNPSLHSILMFNIPRDTRTDIIGKGTVDKINHAYAFGGAEMAISTVEHFLDYPIDYYVKVNMEGFEAIIDILGGVEVNNPMEFTYEGNTFHQGQLQLDGKKALLFSRMRYDDPRGDLGRNARQREIMKAVLQRALGFGTLASLPRIMEQVSTHVKTNITFDEMTEFIQSYRPEIHSIAIDEIAGAGRRIHDIYYYIVDPKERIRVHERLKKQMQEVN